jgi:hypothetical protein
VFLGRRGILFLPLESSGFVRQGVAKMSQSTSGVQQWQTWRVGTETDGALLTDYKPSDLNATYLSRMISIHPGTVIALRAMGLGGDGHGIQIVISGWMNPHRRQRGQLSSGPGQRLWRGNLLLGATVWGAADVPFFDRPTDWPSGVYREVNNWNSGSGGGYDYPGVTKIGTGSAHLMVLLPTLGYTHLLMEFTGPADAVTIATRLGVVWREAVRGVVAKTL